MTTDQFDNYQLDPNVLGTDWVFSGDQVHLNREPRGKISNWHYYVVDARRSNDYTRTTMGSPDSNIDPNRTTDHGGVAGTHDGWGGHGVDWSLFNYNPYGGRGDGLNVNFRVKNDWLKIMGMGSTSGLDKPAHDVIDEKELVEDATHVQYRNYPTEGYSSFGKKSGGATGDRRWGWAGNTWVPTS
jgi:hypothetical protein